MPDSKESPHGLAPVARSRPRSLASVPPHFLDNTQAKLFGKWFLQIISVRTQHTLLLGTNFTSILQALSFYHTFGGALGPKSHQHFPSVSFVLKRLSLAFPSTPNPRPPTSLVFRLAWLFHMIHPLYMTNPRIQGPGQPIFVFVCVYGRALGFFQRPRSSSS